MQYPDIVTAALDRLLVRAGAVDPSGSEVAGG
jgi:hypothetical protein